MGFLHIEPRVEASPQPPSSSPKRKRDLSSDSEDDLAELLEPDPQPVWSVETLCGLRMRLKRRPVSTVRPEHHKVFTRLLGKRHPHSSLLKQKRELLVNTLPHGKAALKAPHSVSLDNLCSIDSQGQIGARDLARVDVDPREEEEVGAHQAYVTSLFLSLLS